MALGGLRLDGAAARLAPTAVTATPFRNLAG
jgi:hypothetical protein